MIIGTKTMGPQVSGAHEESVVARQEYSAESGIFKLSATFVALVWDSQPITAKAQVDTLIEQAQISGFFKTRSAVF